MNLCFATNNLHKLSEVRAIVDKKIEILSLKDIGCIEELPEEQETLEGNSLQKAKYVLDHYGISCFADDTGLEVDALNGAPGVYSARYAGPQRNDKDNVNLLLETLKKEQNRRAQFRTVITLVYPNQTHVFDGIVKGEILPEAKGTNGFGYDPVFQPEGHSFTMAEMTGEQKNAISHRGNAVRKLVDFLNTTLN